MDLSRTDNWAARMSDDDMEQLNLRAKGVLLTLQRCLTLSYQRDSVSGIARQMGCSRNKVIWMQHVLQLRTGRAFPHEGLGRWPREPRP